MATSIIRNDETDAEIDAKIPETKDGWRAERHLYKLFRDVLPEDWTVLYDTSVTVEKYNKQKETAQFDFLVFVPGKGVCNVDAKGNGYSLINGGVRLEPGARDVFDEVTRGIFIFNEYVRDNISCDSDWGAFSSLVVFTESDFQVGIPGGHPYLQASDLIGVDGTETALPILKKIDELLDGFSWRFCHFISWKDAILRHFTLNSPPIARSDDFLRMEKWSREGLDNEQRDISWKIEQNRSVHIRGAAGTGKTIIAITSAVEFAKQGKRVLYVCFNKALAEQCRNECPGHKQLGVVITHFHSIGEPLAGKNYCVSGQDGRLDRGRTLAQMGSLADDMRLHKMQKFDGLLVDEAQDLSNDEIFVLLSVVKRDRHVAIFSDENQTLFATEWSLNCNVFDVRPVECDLKRNYRNTDKILEHFRSLTGEDTTPMIRPCREFQTKPVQELDTNESIKKVVVGLLSGQLSEGRPRRPRDIVVLSDRNDLLNELINESLSYAGSTIQFKRYQCQKNGESLPWKEGKKMLGKWKDDKCVLAETIQSFKGLEANCVVLVLAGNLPSQDENDRLRYVGESRAKYELYIIDLARTVG